MSDESDRRLRDLFANALELTDPQERERYLAEACGQDAKLRQTLEGLLSAHQEAGGFLKPTIAVGDEKFIGAGPGTVIGRYKLVEEIGEGGFGRVFMAEQAAPVRRTVALKIVKVGMDTREVVSRFEAERQALALMDHPNIARVLDAGATESGRPYFVMELVNGIPITDYCDAYELATEARLQLFMKVCHAVQHAHQKGIIHRDLKPTNILVTVIDGEPVPKIIDFGVAKALGQKLTEKTLLTCFQQLIGTPAYMSPEQAALSGVDVDTRSDIYSLGVLLYELLTGVTPFDRETLHQAALEEIRRMIRETEPPKPSTRLYTMGEKATEVAKHRHTEPGGLQRSLRGDLDWIVMKALEKDRQRRYQAASALAEDLQRHLDHRPVQASPPGVAYRARKFIRRHRVAVAFAAALLGVLTIGLTAALIGFAQAKRARDRALAAEAKAQDEASIATAVKDFLREDLLHQASPRHQHDRDVKLRALVDRAAGEVGNRFRKEPLVEAEIRLTLHQIYSGLSEYTNARAQLNRALEIYGQRLAPEDPRMLKARRSEAELLLEEGRHRESQALFEQLLPIYRRVMGSEHKDTLWLMLRLAGNYSYQGNAAKSQELEEQVLSISRRLLGVEDELTLSAAHNLAIKYIDDDKPAEATKLLEEMLPALRRVYGPESLETTIAQVNLALGYAALGRLEEAQNLEEETLAVQRRILGPKHRNTLLTTVNLAAVYTAQRKPAEAQRLFEEALALYREVLGPEHLDTLRVMHKVLNCYRELGDRMKAEVIKRELLSNCRQALGPEHPFRLTVVHDVALDYRDEKPAEMQKLLEEVLPAIRRVFGPEHRFTLKAVVNLAVAYAAQDRLAEAQQLEEETLETQRRIYGLEHQETLRTMRNLACVYSKQGRLAEAQRLFEEVFTLQRRVIGAEHLETLESMQQLASVLAELGNRGRAQTLYEEVLATRRRALGLEHPDTLRTMSGLARCYYLDQDKLAEAHKLFEHVLAVRRRVLGDDHPDTLFTMNALGRCYQKQGKPDEAKKLYGEVVTGRQRVLGPEHPDTVDTMNALAWMLATCPDPKLRDGRQAVPLAEKVVAATSRTNDTYLDTLAAAYAEMGQFADAAKAQQESIAVLTHPGWKDGFVSRQKLYEAGYPFREYDASAVEQLRREGKLAEVEALQQEQLNIRRVTRGSEHSSVADLLGELTLTLLAAQKFAEAESSARECLAIREKGHPDDWRTFAARSLLGACLLAQKKYAEAEPLLLAGYEGMEQRKAQIPAAGRPHLRGTLQRLVQLYEATDRPAQAAEWEQRLAEFQKAEAGQKPATPPR